MNLEELEKMENKEKYTFTRKIISQVVSDNDKETIKAIKRYCEENDIYPNLISEERLKEVIELGLKSGILQQELSKANDKLKKIHRLIHRVYITGLRNGKTVINDVFQKIDDIIDEPIVIKGDD